ncbi:MAG: mechanosensitive ion channel family protein [Flavobacteriaceae bacterium]
MISGNKYLDYIILVVAILLVAFIILKILRYLLGKFLKRSSKDLNVDPTQYYFLKNALSFVIYLAAIIVIMYSIPELKQLGVTLFAGAGILAAIIGFASQSAFANIISGIFVVIFKPFRVGDTVEISKQYFGTVEDITLRHTVIQDIENKRFIIPNSLMSSEVIHNFHINDEKVGNQVYFGIGYSANIDRAMDIIREEAMQHRFIIDSRTEQEISDGIPQVIIRVIAWADSSINLRATIWSANPMEGFQMKCDLLKAVKERFDREGVEIPFPHRKVILEQKDG